MILSEKARDTILGLLSEEMNLYLDAIKPIGFSEGNLLTERYNSLAAVYREFHQLTHDPFQPDWTKAPEWADWSATDRDGRTWFYEKEPLGITSGGEIWMPDQETHCQPMTCEMEGWRTSLRQRPK